MIIVLITTHWYSKLTLIFYTVQSCCS